MFFSIVCQLLNISITKYRSKNLVSFVTPDSASIESVVVIRREDRFANNQNEWRIVWRDTVSPITPYAFIDSIDLMPGVLQKFTFFTIYQGGQVFKDTISFPSPVPPVLIDVTPAGGIIRGEVFRFIFTSPLDSISLDSAFRIYSYHSLDTFHYSYTWLVIKDTLYISPHPLPRSMDTLCILMKSDFLLDVFGNRFDGNGNNLEEGSPYDDQNLKWKVGMLGDFNSDGYVDALDYVTYFRNALINGDTAYETGPVEGSPPYLICYRDGKMDINDFIGFCRMWEYSLKNRGLPPKRSYGIQATITGDYIVSPIKGYLEIYTTKRIEYFTPVFSTAFRDTFYYIFDVNAGDKIKVSGIIGYRILSNTGEIYGERFYDFSYNYKDIRIYDLIGRKVTTPLKNGIYFIQSNMGKKKIWVIR